MKLKSFLSSVAPSFLAPYWRRLEASPVGYRLAKGAFWSLVGTALSRSLSVISSILVARMLGKVGMGELGIIQSTVGIFSAFAGLGMGLTATKFVAEYRINEPERAGAMLALSASVTWVSGAVMTLAMLVLAPWFADHTLAAPHLTSLIRIGSVLLLLGSVNGAQAGGLAGFEAFKSIAQIDLVCGLLTFPLMVGGAWWFGLPGAVWGLVGSVGLNCVFSHLALRSEAAIAGIPLSANLQPDQWSVLWQFSVPSVLCNVIFGPVNWACSAILVNREGGYAEMGIFNVTMSWFNAVSFIPSILAQVILPLLSSHGIEGGKLPKKLVTLAIKANALAVLPAALVLVAGSSVIMGLYGPGFRGGWPTLIAVVITAAVLAIQSPAIQGIIAAGRMWPVFFMNLGWGVSFFALTAALLSRGALGLAGARLGAYVLNGIWVFWFAGRCVSEPRIREVAQSTSSGGE